MSEALIQLFEGWGIAKVPEQIAYLSDFGELAFSVWETVYAPALATLFAYVIGLPLGIILVIGETGGVRPMPKVLMRILNTIVNLLRSVPFLILMVMVVPLSRLILGTSVGTAATVVPLTVAAAPYVARLVEISLREMDRGVIEAAQAMGCSPWQIVTKVMLPECRPSLINGATNASITILGYGAMSGAIGGGGWGAVALMRGYGRHHVVVMWAAVILLVILVQIIQSIGTALSVKSDRRINNNGSKKRRKS